MKVEPSALVPGTATNTDRGPTLRLSDASPDTARVADAVPRASGKRSPRSFSGRAFMLCLAPHVGATASSGAPGPDARHERKRIARRVEAGRNVQERRHAFDDRSRHRGRVPAGRGVAVSL